MMIMLFGCTTTPTENGEPMAKENTSEEIMLGIGEKTIIDGGNLEIEVKDIVYESIEPDPTDEMPAGSGVSVYVALKKGNETKELTFEDLSEPYTSKKEHIWKEYKIILLNINDNENKATFKIEKQ